MEMDEIGKANDLDMDGESENRLEGLSYNFLQSGMSGILYDVCDRSATSQGSFQHF